MTRSVKELILKRSRFLLMRIEEIFESIILKIALCLISDIHIYLLT